MSHDASRSRPNRNRDLIDQAGPRLARIEPRFEKTDRCHEAAPLEIDIGREERFMKLFLAHERRIRAFILALVPNWSDAEDLLQDTSAVMWRKLDQFQPGTNFLAWALSIARYQVLNFRRKRRREFVFFSDETVERLAASLELMAASSDDRRDALANCVNKLVERDRELVQLRYQSGATLQMIAERVGRSFQGVHKSLNRIHERLLTCVQEALSNEGLVS